MELPTVDVAVVVEAGEVVGGAGVAALHPGVIELLLLGGRHIEVAEPFGDVLLVRGVCGRALQRVDADGALTGGDLGLDALGELTAAALGGDGLADALGELLGDRGAGILRPADPALHGALGDSELRGGELRGDREPVALAGEEELEHGFGVAGDLGELVPGESLEHRGELPRLRFLAQCHQINSFRCRLPL